MKNLKEITKFRHTVKAYDSSKTIDENTFKEIMDFTRFAPNSFNLQTTRLISINRDSEINKELNTEEYLMFNSPLVKQADRVVYFVIPRKGLTPDTSNELFREGIKYGGFQRSNKVSEVTEEMIDKLATPILGAWKSMGFTDFGIWSAKQAYIYLGYLTIGAAAKGVDTTSMEGFHPKKVSELFRSKGMITKDEEVIVSVAMGYRLNETSFNNSERKPMDTFVKKY